MNPNTLIALQLLIELTTQGLKIQQALKQAHDEGRDITPDELKSASSSADLAIARLKVALSDTKV